ncbi:hypothetical protein D9758_003977 [Tetrapyrgos nigripes]|uniref:Uncharacterized protein n=1 Tax=Tetrapyrgos nigripes TaxID=182062 RepID=A0A8H5GLT2_9AGAR|nr:hypothetical protein D9758_003977 [Tetrapyrgos nigripes]
MVASAAAPVQAPASTTSSTSAFGQGSPFGQQPSMSAFGQTQTVPAFSQPSSSQPSVFGQPQQTSTFSDQSQQTSAFGSQSSSQSVFGQPSGFGQQSSAPTFGQSSFGTPASVSTFGQPSAFGQSSFTQPSTTSSAFSAFASNNPSPFGAGFGSPTPNANKAPPSSSTPDESMSDSTPSFGGLSLGGDDGSSSKPKSSFGGIFGSSATSSDQNASESTSNGSVIKPASGFGAFGASGGAFGNKTVEQPSAFSGGAFSAKPTTQSAFGDGSNTNSTQPSSGFGQPSFGKPAFGQSSFGQPGFGQTGFGTKAPPTPASNTGGFSAFAGSPSVFGGSTPKSNTTSNTSGGFASFATGTSAFGATSSSQSPFSGNASPKPDTTAPPAGGTFASFASTGPSVFGKPASTQEAASSSHSPFAGNGSSKPETITPPTGGAFASFASTGPSVFGKPAPTQEAKSAFSPAPESKSSSNSGSAAATPSQGSVFASPPPQPVASPSASSPPSTPPAKSPPAQTPTPSSASFFKPDSGFGGFGVAISKDSPFLKATQNKTPPVSAFALSGATSPPAPSTSSSTPTFGSTSKIGSGSTTPTFGTPSKPGFGSAPGPTFGSTSKLGFGFGMSSSPAATPSTPPEKPSEAATNAFSAFSGSASPFSKLGAGKSFGDLFKDNKKETSEGKKEDEEKDKKTPEAEKEQKEIKKEDEDEEVTKEKAQSSSDATEVKEEGSPKAKTPSVTEPEESAAPVPSKQAGDREKTPVPVFSPPPKDEASKGKDKVEPPLTPPPEDEGFGKLATQPSSESVSSQASSFVNVSREDADSSEEPADSEEEAEAEDEYDEHGEDSDGSFLSEHSDFEEEEEEETDRTGSPSPDQIPLPPSRSRSNTPQQEGPSIKVTSEQSPAASDVSSEDDESDSSRLSTIREESTTPPGSPTKSQDVSAPVVASPAPVSQASLSLGGTRPSTRPTRSSPLASTPLSLSGEEEEDEQLTPKRAPLEIKPVQHKPRPASPRPPFGILPTKTTTVEDSEDSKTPSTKRPKTPPLLSSFMATSTTPELSSTPPSLFGGKPAPLLSTPLTNLSSTPASTSSAPSNSGNSFGVKPFGSPSIPPAPVNTTGDASSSGVFIMPRGASPVPAGSTPSASTPNSFFKQPFAPSPSAFGKPGAPLSAPSILPAAMPPTPTISPATIGSPLMSAGGLSGEQQPKLPNFNPPPGKPVPGMNSNLFGSPAAAPSASPAPLMLGRPGMEAPTTPKPKPASPGIAGMPGVPIGFGTPGNSISLQQYQEGMQQECVLLCITIAKELDDLRQLAERAAAKREALGKSASGSRRKEDLGDASKWGLADMAQFGQVLVTFQKDVEEINKKRETLQTALEDLHKGMIKANTRREEVARFNKAQADNEFSKMLKLRTLGPEHQENQTQLRRSIRAVDTRVSQLEDRLKAYKKRLSEINSGKPAFRAPTLDVINRTYRNIDIAIQKQMDDVDYLSKRVAKLDLSPASSSSPRASPKPNGRFRSPGPSAQNGTLSKRPWNITPDVAVTTAAALNAERSAHKLKTVLLAARTEPLLNEKAKEAKAPPVAFNMGGTPATHMAGGSVGAGGGGIQFNTPLHLGANYQPPEMDWNNFPEDRFQVTTPVAAERRGGGHKREHGVIHLKKSPNQSTLLDGPSPSPGGFESPSAPTGKLALPSSPPPPKFDWGPLPNTPPKADQKGKGKAPDVKPGLLGSPSPSTGGGGGSGGGGLSLPSGFVGFSSFRPKSTAPATPPGNTGNVPSPFGGGIFGKPPPADSKPSDLSGSWVADGFK